MESHKRGRPKAAETSDTARNSSTLNVENWDITDDYECARPLYSKTELLPWEEDVSGFEVAYDRGAEDDLSRFLHQSDDPDPPHRAIAYLRMRASESPVLSNRGPYHQLRNDEIRVLRLQPGLQGPLRGSLIPVSIDADSWQRAPDADLPKRVDYTVSAQRMAIVRYTAISYCWDHFDDRLPVEIDGHTVHVFPTVDAILRSLRHPERHIHVWIDQICINQADQADKEHQIKRMGAVYELAYNTLIWLRDGADDGAFFLLQSIAYGLWGIDEKYEQAVTTMAPMIARRHKAMRALIELFKSRWFQRTWVAQELAVSRNSYVKFGARAMPWTGFSSAATYLEDFDVFGLAEVSDQDKALAMQGVRSMSRLENVRIQTLQGNSDSMLFVLEETRVGDVTIPIDKIYGILGLCRNNIPVDYSKTAPEVFKAVARGLYGDSGLRPLLRNVDHEGQPSWVPDWSLKRRTTPIASGLRAYQNAGGRIERNTLESNLLTDAVIFTMIVSVSAPFYSAEMTDLKQAIDFAHDADFRNFCATIVAGQNHSGKLAWPETYIEVLSLMCDEASGRKPTFPGQVYSRRQERGYFTMESLKQRLPKQTLWSLKQAFCKAMLNRRLAWAKELILVPQHAREGDVVAIILGCGAPFVLRERSSGYTLVGECYVESLMDGGYLERHRHDVKEISIC